MGVVVHAPDGFLRAVSAGLRAGAALLAACLDLGAAIMGTSCLDCRSASCSRRALAALAASASCAAVS